MVDDDFKKPPLLQVTMPPQPTTKPLPQEEIQAGLLARLLATVDRVEKKTDQGFVAVKADFGLLSGQFESLERDVRGMQSWRVRVDDDREQVRAQLARHSDRAKNPSEIDLEIKAVQGLEIAKNVEQDKKIDETHVLAAAAVAKLAELAAAADARAKVLDSIASTVGSALKSKMAEKIAYAGGGVILAAIAYYAKKWGFG
jgi:hypothetical protein